MHPWWHAAQKSKQNPFSRASQKLGPPDQNWAPPTSTLDFWQILEIYTRVAMEFDKILCKVMKRTQINVFEYFWGTLGHSNNQNF